MKNNILYGLVVFSVFLILTYILRLASGKFPEGAVLFGVFKSSDFLLGGAIALILMYSRRIKSNSNKK